MSPGHVGGGFVPGRGGAHGEALLVHGPLPEEDFPVGGAGGHVEGGGHNDGLGAPITHGLGQLLKAEIKADAENLASSIGVLLTALESDEELPKEEKAKQEEKTYEIEDVRKILADKSRLGHTAKIRELLEKYGAKKLSEIDPSNYKDLVADVEKL